MDEVMRKLQREAERIAARHQLPDFYIRFKAPMALARRLYYSDPLVFRLREMLRGNFQEDLGHGEYHCMRVSLDSATILFVELEPQHLEMMQVERLMVLALFAGLLHDIRRADENHAQAGADRAEQLLGCFPLAEDEIHCVCRAIRNHEAFQATLPCSRPWSQLMSDCLYDADKFRWGPDNFTHTLWHMVSHRGISPQELIDRFPWGVSGILRIIETFRTGTGRQFGPEIIETGVEIGKEIYRYLLKHHREGSVEAIRRPATDPVGNGKEKSEP